MHINLMSGRLDAVKGEVFELSDDEEGGRWRGRGREEKPNAY